jgi:ribosomal protein S18 acetylase RimI-like enzyme
MMPGIDEGYELVEAIPSVDDYLRLRRTSGLTSRSRDAAEAGLPSTFFAVCIRRGGETVGMGRIISDGALFFHLVDVAVEPAHQGRGLGKAVVAALLAHVRRIAPAEAYVSLMANGEAHRLYAGFGFLPVAPDARGMELWTNGAAEAP